MIANFNQLASSTLRKQALLISQAGLAATAIDRLLGEVDYHSGRDYLAVGNRKFSLRPYQHIILLGIGTGSVPAASQLYSALGGRLTAGFVIDNQVVQLPRMVSRQATPGPSIANAGITKDLMALLTDCSADDLIISVITGGDVLTAPAGLILEDKRAILSTLDSAGASPDEVNIIRNHLSRARGGHLAKLAYPASMINLILADPDQISQVAGGPTVRDQSTIHDAQSILARYDVLRRCGLVSCSLVETPKKDHYFSQVSNISIPVAGQARLAMVNKAKDLGFRVKSGNHWARAEHGECWIADQSLGQDLLVGSLPPEGVLVTLGKERSALVDTTSLAGARSAGLADLSAGSWAQDIDYQGNFSPIMSPLAVYLRSA